MAASRENVKNSTKDCQFLKEELEGEIDNLEEFK